MSSYIDRKKIIEEFLKTIYRLSDEKYQERVWLRGEGPECNEIDDTVCDFFDDGNPILERYRDFGITELQYKLLIKLHVRLRNFTDTFGVYSDDKSTEELLELPEWQEIRVISKSVLKMFDFKKKINK